MLPMDDTLKTDDDQTTTFHAVTAPKGQFNSENSRKVGRPRVLVPDRQTFDEIERLAKMHLNKKELIEFFDCAPSTLHLFFAAFPEARQAYNRGFASGHLSLRHAMLRKALKGNVPLLIYFGRKWLGQSDRKPPRRRTGEIKIIVVGKEAE